MPRPQLLHVRVRTHVFMLCRSVAGVVVGLRRGGGGSFVVFSARCVRCADWRPCLSYPCSAKHTEGYCSKCYRMYGTPAASSASSGGGAAAAAAPAVAEPPSRPAPTASATAAATTTAPPSVASPEPSVVSGESGAGSTVRRRLHDVALFVPPTAASDRRRWLRCFVAAIGRRVRQLPRVCDSLLL